MGLKTSPSAFSQLMEYVFQRFHNAVIYLDNILIGSGTWDSHMEHLDHELERMKRHNLKIGLRNACTVGTLSGENIVVKEQFRRGIIDGVDASGPRSNRRTSSVKQLGTCASKRIRQWQSRREWIIT